MKTLLYITYFSLFGFCLACEDTPSPYPDRVRLLTNNSIKKWTTISIESADESTGIDCEEDDILTFNIFDPLFGGVYEGAPTFSITEGFIRCSYSPYYYYSSSYGSWRLNNTQTRLILTEGEGENRVNRLYDILELSESKLVLRRRIESYYDLSVTVKTYTYESL